MKPTPDGLETIKITEVSTFQSIQDNEPQEEFECLEVTFFIEEYESLLSNITAFEFELRSGKYFRDSDKLASAFSLVLDVKREVKDKIQYLREADSIIPLNLLKEVKDVNNMFLELKNDIKSEKIKGIVDEEFASIADVMVVTKPKKQKKHKK